MLRQLKILILFSFLNILSYSNSFAQTRQFFKPFNQTYQDSSLTTFICKLQYVLVLRDYEKLKPFLDTSIGLSYGGSYGLHDLEIMWKPQDPKSFFWEKMSQMISLGGGYTYPESKDDFVYPYVCTFNGIDSVGFEDALIVIGKNVNLRTEPTTKSKVLAQVSYEILQVDYSKTIKVPEKIKLEGVKYYGETEWYFVQTLDKKLKGYIHSDYVWSSIGLRMYLKKKNGDWLITEFISGF